MTDSRQKRYFVCLMLLSLLLTLPGCGKKEPTGYPISYGDISLERTPRRVVSLSPALTESVYMLGYGGRVVGVSGFCDRPGVTDTLPRCGTAQSPDLTAIYDLKPDLLISGERLYSDALDALNEMGIAVIVLPRAEDMEGIIEGLGDILYIFSGEIKSEGLKEQLRFYIETQADYVTNSVKAFISGEDEAPAAVYVARPDFTLATGDTVEGGLLRDMGLVNPAEGHTGWSFPKEEGEELNPDVIFYSDALSPDDITGSAVYAKSAAAKADRLYPIDSRSLERQSPAMFLELETAARLAFPDAFLAGRPVLTPPPPEEPETEPKWYKNLFDWLK